MPNQTAITGMGGDDIIPLLRTVNREAAEGAILVEELRAGQREVQSRQGQIPVAETHQLDRRGQVLVLVLRWLGDDLQVRQTGLLHLPTMASGSERRVTEGHTQTPTQLLRNHTILHCGGPEELRVFNVYFSVVNSWASELTADRSSQLIGSGSSPRSAAARPVDLEHPQNVARASRRGADVLRSHQLPGGIREKPHVVVY
ncbi:hypothetical protein EYF80_001966 [Liparis tanakae]|uniref:Uncharacterized protein n=1 Tax=Liparis tanakae TaxID=230148 RepID=A0A4Z2JBL7_9TELE|nr:hypothetical protein EYF80_001966 [Liparis tanakae]